MSALRGGATHLWANTILFAEHPLQVSARVGEYGGVVGVVGQPPVLVEAFDDKDYVNSLLRAKGTFTMPRSWIFESQNEEWRCLLGVLPYPVVGKPIRGRGSHGVKKCDSRDELEEHVGSLFAESASIMVEEYLSGEEATVTVMPPSKERGGSYWSMPIVTRFNHIGGIAPYNGAVAVAANSRAVTREEYAKDPTYDVVARECEAVADQLRPTAPIRIDVRRFRDEASSKFALFDVNMKPVCASFLIPMSREQICKGNIGGLILLREYDGAGETWTGGAGELDASCGGGDGLGLWEIVVGDVEKLF